MKNEIKSRLTELSDEKYKTFSESLIPNCSNILGVRIPIIRKYAKELVKKYTISEIIENIDNEYFEEIMLFGFVIGLEKDFSKTKKYLDRFIPLISNWSICDSFCASLKITKNNMDEMWKIILSNIDSKKEFKVRFGLVMILNYYVCDEKLDDIFKILDNITNNEYYVQMAAAWLLQVCFVCNFDKTYSYFKSCLLNDDIKKKTIQKVCDSYKFDKNQKHKIKELR